LVNFNVKNSYDTLPGYCVTVILMSMYKGHKLPENKLHCNKQHNLAELSDKYKHNKMI